jgi:AcrR family transcriptional regulator
MRTKDEEKIPRIYHAAIKIINSDGFEGCSMSKIALEANVSPATIYLYFENKEDMIKKLFIHVKERMGHSYFKDNMDLSVSKGTFRSIWLNHYQYVMENIDEYVFIENFSNSPQISHIDKEYTIDFCPVSEALYDRSKKAKLIQNLNNDIIYSLLFAPLSYLVKKSKANKTSVSTNELMQVFEASWRAVSL